MAQLIKCVAFMLCIVTLAVMLTPCRAEEPTSPLDGAENAHQTRDALEALVACEPVANCSGNGTCNGDGSCSCFPKTYGPHCGNCNSTIFMNQVRTGTFYGEYGINYTTWSVTMTAGPLAWLTNVYITADLFQFFNPIFSASGIIPTDDTYTYFTLPAGAYSGGYIRSGTSYTFTYSIYGNSSATFTISDQSCVPPVQPTVPPTVAPTIPPTRPPTVAPTVAPTVPPTRPPTVAPTVPPTVAPTRLPTVPPTATPIPTRPPTVAPTVPPTAPPTRPPTVPPTATPIPTRPPTTPPTAPPTVAPTRPPTAPPTAPPTTPPTLPPTAFPSPVPTAAPSCAPCPKKPTTLPMVPYLTGDNQCTGETQQQILSDLYNALGGASWTNRANWGGSNVCVYYGVTCDANSNVISINLASNNLRGNQIPPSLGCLTKLQYLVLDNNVISGQIPNNFCKLTTLLNLTISNNNLGGVIPTCFANLVGLQQLWLQFNGLIGGLPSFVSYSNLRDLRLNDNCLSGGIPQSIPSTHIVNINFGDNSFGGCIPDTPYHALGTAVNYAGNLFCLGALPCWLAPTTISCPINAPPRTNVNGNFPWCAATCLSEFN